MKLGALVRADQGGLANQTVALVQRLKPDSVLLIDLPEHQRRGDSQAHRLTNLPVYAVTDADRIPRDLLAAFAATVDTLLTVECLYTDPAGWVKVNGLTRTVLVANPELYVDYPAQQIILPTSWHADRFPGAPVVPHPVDVEAAAPRARVRDEVSTFLHVMAPAMVDRNGSELVAAALPHVTEPCTLLVRSHLPEPRGALRNPAGKVKVVWDHARPEDWRDCYPPESDVLLLPRRYGGLCMAVGTRVATPEGDKPIEDLRPSDPVMDDHGVTTVVAVNRYLAEETRVVASRGVTLRTTPHHLHRAAAAHEGPLEDVRADEVRPGHWLWCIPPTPTGITSVKIGPKPVIKALRKWWEQVELDWGWMRIVGLYLAEGHTSTGKNGREYATVWNIGERDEYLADELVGLLEERGLHATKTHIHQKPGSFGLGSVWRVRARSLWLHHFWDALGVGRGAYNKHAPDVAPHLVLPLVGGWLEGDGSTRQVALTGYSKSTAMIYEFSRLLQKIGMFPSVAMDGNRLDINRRDDVHRLCDVTTRFPRPPDLQRVRPHRKTRDQPWGWRVVVDSARQAGPAEVVSIQTESGHYIANGFLTHNSMVVQEAAALGIPTVMLDVDPQRAEGWPGWRLPAWVHRTSLMRGGEFPVHACDPIELARVMSAMVRGEVDVAGESQRALAWASARSWPAVKDQWGEALGIQTNGVKQWAN